MDILRTPDDRFAALPGYDFAPHYVDVDGLRMHYVDEGPAGAPPLLLLHGEPSWSFLITRGGDRLLQKLIPGAHERAHPTIAGAGHFRQEDEGDALAAAVVAFIAATP